MGKHMPDIDLFPVVVNGNNQAIFVPRDAHSERMNLKLFEALTRFSIWHTMPYGEAPAGKGV
jgi:hypothetical protein